MKTAKELRMLRRGKGYDSMRSVTEEMTKRGVPLTPQAYCNKENGKFAFRPAEIKVLAEIFGMTLEEAFEYYA